MYEGLEENDFDIILDEEQMFNNFIIDYKEQKQKESGHSFFILPKILFTSSTEQSDKFLKGPFFYHNSDTNSFFKL